jgi:ATP-binding cassette subfamily F protein 3
VLSGGERSRVALVRLLLQPANLLLLDEPTSHLDLSAISVLTQALRRFAGTLVFASHDEYFIAQLATKVLEVTRDRVRLYHGGWDYYQWKRAAATADGPSRERAPGAVGRVADPAPAQRQRDGGRRGAGRKRGRRSPEALQRRQQALLDECERLQQTERRLQDQLGDPAVYTDGGRVRELKRRLQANSTAQQETTAAWEEIERTLEGTGSTAL